MFNREEKKWSIENPVGNFATQDLVDFKNGQLSNVIKDINFKIRQISSKIDKIKSKIAGITLKINKVKSDKEFFFGEQEDPTFTIATCLGDLRNLDKEVFADLKKCRAEVLTLEREVQEGLMSSESRKLQALCLKRSFFESFAKKIDRQYPPENSNSSWKANEDLEWKSPLEPGKFNEWQGPKESSSDWKAPPTYNKYSDWKAPDAPTKKSSWKMDPRKNEETEAKVTRGFEPTQDAFDYQALKQRKSQDPSAPPRVTDWGKEVSPKKTATPRQNPESIVNPSGKMGQNLDGPYYSDSGRF